MTSVALSIARHPLVRGAAIVAIIAVSVEVTTRISEWIRFGTPFLSPFNGVDELTVRDAAGMHGRPFATYRKWSLSDIGLRGPSVTARPADGVWRLGVGGASETFGLYETPGHEYPRQLEDSLNARLATRRARCPDLPVTRFEVLNLALPGMSLPTFTQDLAARHGQRGIAAVVFYASPPQYLYDEPPVAAAPDSSPGAGRLSPWRALRLRSVSRFREQFKQLLPGWVSARLRTVLKNREIRSHSPDWRLRAVPTDRLDQFGTDLRRLVGVVHQIGAIPVLVTHVNYFSGARTIDQPAIETWERFYPRAPGDVLIDFDHAAGDVIERVARDSGATDIDLRTRVHGEGRRYFADAVHFTDNGAAVVAGAMADALERLALGPSDAACKEPS